MWTIGQSISPENLDTYIVLCARFFISTFLAHNFRIVMRWLWIVMLSWFRLHPPLSFLYSCVILCFYSVHFAFKLTFFYQHRFFDFFSSLIFHSFCLFSLEFMSFFPMFWIHIYGNVHHLRSCFFPLKQAKIKLHYWSKLTRLIMHMIIQTRVARFYHLYLSSRCEMSTSTVKYMKRLCKKLPPS